MKTSSLIRFAPLAALSCAFVSFSACNGGGSSTSASPASAAASAAAAAQAKANAQNNNNSTTVVYEDPTPTVTYTPAPVFVYTAPIVDPAPVIVSDSGSSYDDSGDDYDSGDDGYTDDGGCDASGCSSLGAITHDTDLQKATVQNKNVNSRAQIVATNFQMSVDKAAQLVQLADKVKLMTKQGTMTSADQNAISNAAFKIAGVTSDQVSRAVTGANNGKMDAANSLLSTAAANLGMPSAASLRDKLLPSLGVDLNN